MKSLNNYSIAIAWAVMSAAGCINDTDTSASGDINTARHPEVPANNAIAPESLTSIEWVNTKKDLGTVREGEQLEVIYAFKNTGKKPLTIASAQPSCGCTVPQKPEKPIMPGETGEIKAVFDSKGRAGANHKTITVTCNTEPSTNHVLEFDVNVTAAPKPIGS